jgi:hypothetical protein
VIKEVLRGSFALITTEQKHGVLHSSGTDIKEDKENILVDELASVFPFEPPMRARL